MPLRDHFRPPISTRVSWEGFHGMWPATIVQQLSRELPPEFIAEPRTHLGSYYEIDVCAYEEAQTDSRGVLPSTSGTAAMAVMSPSEPTLALETDLSEQYNYEVLVYDESRGRVLVAAVEIVSPANKDRAESRRAFVAKCAALLQQRVCVSIVDLVTARQFNLYTELLELIGQSDPTFGAKPPPAIYAATCRGRKVGDRPRMEIWAYPLTIGRALPTLPLWIRDDLAVSLDLESSYEETCRALRIR